MVESTEETVAGLERGLQALKEEISRLVNMKKEESNVDPVVGLTEALRSLTPQSDLSMRQRAGGANASETSRKGQASRPFSSGSAISRLRWIALMYLFQKDQHSLLTIWQVKRDRKL